MIASIKIRPCILKHSDRSRSVEPQIWTQVLCAFRKIANITNMNNDVLRFEGTFDPIHKISWTVENRGYGLVCPEMVWLRSEQACADINDGCYRETHHVHQPSFQSSTLGLCWFRKIPKNHLRSAFRYASVRWMSSRMIEYKGTTSEPTVIYHDESGSRVRNNHNVTSWKIVMVSPYIMASHGDMYGESWYGFHQLMETYTRCAWNWYHRSFSHRHGQMIACIHTSWSSPPLFRLLPDDKIATTYNNRLSTNVMDRYNPWVCVDEVCITLSTVASTRFLPCRYMATFREYGTLFYSRWVLWRSLHFFWYTRHRNSRTMG
jgi:hypothetical protein